MDQRHRGRGGSGVAAFTRAGVLRGARAALALALGLAPFGLVIGAVSDSKGLSLLETWLMAGLVFAGTSQLVALELWSDPAPVLGATLACLAINLRLAPMGAALAPMLDRLRGVRLWGTLATLVDNAFALTVAEMRAGRRDAGFLLGAGLAMWANWMAMVTLGHVLGGVVRLPPGHPAFFAATAALLALLVPIWRGPRADLVPWAVAGAVALAAHGALGLGAPWPVLAGALAGAAAGAALDGRREGTAAAAAAERRGGAAVTLRPDVLAAILGMALATYLCRAGGYALLRAARPPAFAQAMLRHLPGCLFVAFLAPALTSGGPAAWAAAAATVAAQAALGRLALSIAAGVAVLWLLRGPVVAAG